MHLPSQTTILATRAERLGADIEELLLGELLLAAELEGALRFEGM